MTGTAVKQQQLPTLVISLASILGCDDEKSSKEPSTADGGSSQGEASSSAAQSCGSSARDVPPPSRKGPNGPFAVGSFAVGRGHEKAEGHRQVPEVRVVNLAKELEALEHQELLAKRKSHERRVNSDEAKASAHVNSALDSAMSTSSHTMAVQLGNHHLYRKKQQQQQQQQQQMQRLERQSTVEIETLSSSASSSPVTTPKVRPAEDHIPIMSKGVAICEEVPEEYVGNIAAILAGRTTDLIDHVHQSNRGYVMCAQCQRNFPETNKIDGRLEVRMLPCFHSLCGPCLEDALKEASHDEKELECPLCSRSFKKKTLHDFMPNFEVLAKIDHELIDGSDIVCEECTMSSMATTYCKECVMNLCGACERQHRRSKATARHTIISLMEQNQRSVAPEDMHRAHFCGVHRHWRYEFFCEDCDALICSQCALSGHENHNYKLPSASLVERHRKLLEGSVRKLARRLQEAQQRQKLLSERLVIVERAEKQAKQDINQAFDKLLWDAKGRCSELKRHLVDGCRERRSYIEGQKLECSMVLHDIWRSIDFLERTIEHGTDVEVLQLKAHLFQAGGHLRHLQHWMSLVQENEPVVWKPGDITAGWRSGVEGEQVLRELAGFGSVSNIQNQSARGTDMEDNERASADAQPE